MIFTSPLEQFELLIFKPFPTVYFSLTTMSISLIIATTLFILTFFLGFYKARLIPTPLQTLCESSYLFILSIVKQQAGQKGLRYFPLFFVIFFLILFSNLIGLVPFTFTPTSHIVITFTLAFTCNLAFIIIGFKENGLSFLRLFVPNGSPRFLLPIIVVIEFISYLLRTFSLSIRLFANIMAGHTLMHILASFVTAFLNVLPIFALFPFIIVLAVVILEVCIAFLQAYVFLILLTIYLEDSFHPSH
jgi:F-type H+-transporting ATPase subunit a